MEDDSTYYGGASDNRSGGNNPSPLTPFYSTDDLRTQPHDTSSSSTSPQLSSHRSDFTIPPAPRFLSSSLPVNSTLSGQNAPSRTRARKRGRPPLTNEQHPSMEDSRVLVSLGMSPFMPGQDTIYNQNRLVRNEVVLSRHLSNLRRSCTQLELDQAKLSEEVNRTLDSLKARADGVTVMPTGARTRDHAEDLDFRRLRQDYIELRQMVNEILRHIVSPSASSRGRLVELDEAANRLSPGPLRSTSPAYQHAANETHHIQQNLSFSVPPTTSSATQLEGSIPGEIGTGWHPSQSPSDPFLLARPQLSRTSDSRAPPSFQLRTRPWQL